MCSLHILLVALLCAVAAADGNGRVFKHDLEGKNCMELSIPRRVLPSFWSAEGWRYDGYASGKCPKKFNVLDDSQKDDAFPSVWHFKRGVGADDHKNASEAATAIDGRCVLDKSKPTRYIRVTNTANTTCKFRAFDASYIHHIDCPIIPAGASKDLEINSDTAMLYVTFSGQYKKNSEIYPKASDNYKWPSTLSVPIKEKKYNDQIEEAPLFNFAAKGNCTDADKNITLKDTQKFSCACLSCARSHFFAVDPTSKCIAESTGLTSPCSNCFGQVAHCVFMNCAAQCLASPIAPKCLKCGHAHCDNLGTTCTGLPLVADPTKPCA